MEKMNLFGDSRQDSKVSLFDYSTDLVYHGSSVVVKKPVIIIGKTTKDFGYGFYITKIKEQAYRWSTRFGAGIINIFKYNESEDLKILRFVEINDNWLDFITDCRAGLPHDYDIVEGPMADDKIFRFLRPYLDGEITRTEFLKKAKFNRPTHQICLCTDKALACLTFVNYEEVQ